VHRLRPERRGGVLQHLQPCSRRTVRNGRKKDGVGVGGMEEGADRDQTLPFARINLSARSRFYPDGRSDEQPSENSGDPTAKERRLFVG
jgi:hypothetical protein